MAVIVKAESNSERVSFTMNMTVYWESIAKEYVVPLFMTEEEFKAYKNVVNYKVL